MPCSRGGSSKREVPFVEVTLGGWDTHDNNFAQVKNLCDTLDPAWAAAYGRPEGPRVARNDDGGVDGRVRPHARHQPRATAATTTPTRGAWCSAAAASGRAGDRQHDSKDGMKVGERPVAVTDLLATICLAIGIDPSKQNMSNVSRPIRIVGSGAQAGHGGAVVKWLVAVLLVVFAVPGFAARPRTSCSRTARTRSRCGSTSARMENFPKSRGNSSPPTSSSTSTADGNDGFLSEAEAKRVLPLPLPGGKESALDFAAIDTNNSGRILFDVRESYRKNGFTPGHARRSRRPPAEVFALSDALSEAPRPR